MATSSGNMSTAQVDGGRYCYLSWQRVSATDNITKISWTVSIKDSRSSYQDIWYKTGNVYFTVTCPSSMGVGSSSSGTTSNSYTKTIIAESSRLDKYPGELASGYFYVTHNDSGEGQFRIKLNAAIYSTTDASVTKPSSSTYYELASTKTKNSAPTSVKTSTSIVTPTGSFKVSWSGAKAGAGNSIVGYRVYYHVGTKSAAPTAGDSSISVSSSATSTTISLSLPSSQRGYIVTAGVAAMASTNTSNQYNSAIQKQTSGQISINRLPNAPTISSAIIITSSQTSATVKATAGSDSDGQSYSVYYSTSSSSSSPSAYSNTIPSSLLPSEGSSRDYYFWTSDGLERSSSYSTLKITRNTAPSVSGSVTLDSYRARGSSTSTYADGATLNWSVSGNNPRLYFTINSSEPQSMAWPAGSTSYYFNAGNLLGVPDAGSTVNWSASAWIYDGVESTTPVNFSGIMAGLPSGAEIVRYNSISSTSSCTDSVMEIGQNVKFRFARDYSILNNGYKVEVSSERGNSYSCSVTTDGTTASDQYLNVTLDTLPLSLESLTFKITGTTTNGLLKTTQVSGIVEGKHPVFSGSLEGFPQEIYPLTQQNVTQEITFPNPFGVLTNINDIKTQYDIPDNGIKLELSDIDGTLIKEINLEPLISGIQQSTFRFDLPYNSICNTINVTDPSIISTFNGTRTYIPRVKVQNNKGIVFYGPTVEGGFILNFESDFETILEGILLDNVVVKGRYGSGPFNKSVLREGMTWNFTNMSVRGYTVQGLSFLGLLRSDYYDFAAFNISDSDVIGNWKSSNGYWQIDNLTSNSTQTLGEIKDDTVTLYAMVSGTPALAYGIDNKKEIDAIKHTTGVINLNALNVSDSGLEYNLTFEDTGVSSRVSVASSSLITTSSTASAVNNNSSIPSGAYFKEIFVDEEGNAVTSEFSIAQSGKGTVAVTDSSNWDYKDISIKVVTWIKQDGYTTRKEYTSPFMTAYKTMPLISYRKKHLGINTSEPAGTDVLLDINALDGYSNVYLRRQDEGKEWQFNIENGTVEFRSNNVEQWRLPYAAGDGIAISSGEISIQPNLYTASAPISIDSSRNISVAVASPFTINNNNQLDIAIASPFAINNSNQLDIAIASPFTIDNNALSLSLASPIVLQNNSISLATNFTGDTSFAPGAQTPGFGSTFTIPNIVFDMYGRAKSLTTSTVKIPNAAVTTSAAGLMSAADKVKLNNWGDLSYFGGYHGSSAADITFSSGTIKNVTSFSLTSGLWLIKATLVFASNSTGRRAVMLSNSSGGDEWHVWDCQSMTAISGGKTYVNLVTFVDINASTTVYITGYQNSGGNLTATPRYLASKIGTYKS